MTSSTELAEELHVDYDFAQQEIMQQAHDPIQESIEAIEKQYENDKQGLSSLVCVFYFIALHMLLMLIF